MDINAFITSHEVGIRLGVFFGIFAMMATWESITPRCPLTVSKPLRWFSNIGIVFLNSFVVWLLFPAAAAAVGMAQWMSAGLPIGKNTP